jgi:hypothetical protein
MDRNDVGLEGLKRRFANSTRFKEIYNQFEFEHYKQSRIQLAFLVLFGKDLSTQGFTQDQAVELA